MYNKPTSYFRNELSDDMYNKDLCIHGVGFGMFFRLLTSRRAVRASKACPARHTLSSPLQNLGQPSLFFSFIDFCDCSVFTGVGLCQSLHYIMFQPSSVIKLGTPVSIIGVSILVNQ